MSGRALVISDKETADEVPSPILWLPLEQPWPDDVSSANIRHEATATVRGTRKIEGLTKSAEGDLVFATSDFDWPPNDESAEPDLYNRLLYWPIGRVDQAAIANPTSNGDVVSSVSLRPHFIAALKSDKYPSGPPYFKIEGLVATPNRELWFGVREVGPDYEHPDYTVAILKASYFKSENGTVAVQPPFSVVTPVDTSVRVPSRDRLGLSSLARHDDTLAMLTRGVGGTGRARVLHLGRPSPRNGTPRFSGRARRRGPAVETSVQGGGRRFRRPEPPSDRVR